jgi:translation initiation factor 1
MSYATMQFKSNKGFQYALKQILMNIANILYDDDAKPFLSQKSYLLSVSEDYDTNSMDDILRELDREKTNIIISKEIRRYKKSTTILRGLQDRTDVESLTRELKTKIGTGGTYKEGQIILQGDHRESVKDLLIAKGYNEKSIEIM